MNTNNSNTNNSNTNERANNDSNKNKYDFKKIVSDFCLDLSVTFHEFKTDLEIILNSLVDEVELSKTYEYCKTVFPERFFDILYQNENIFSRETDEGNNINTCFLPNIDFKKLWEVNDITDKTRETIWKYLQLLLFTIISDVTDKNSFGDTAKLFEAINENEFREKLEETFDNIKNIFDNGNFDTETNQFRDNETEDNCSGSPKFNFSDLPNVEDMHSHINGMMGGKLGQLAKEIAEETASELNMDMSNVNSVNDAFQKMFKNPTKLMGLVKSVGDKLDDKIKSGDIKESELIQEATDIIKRMRDMPGMENIQNMLGKMGIPGMGNLGGRNSKMDFSQMENHLNRNLKKAQMKEKMKSKVEQKQQSELYSSNVNNVIITKEQQEKEANILRVLNSGSNDEIENFIFSTGEKVEKSKRKNNKSKNKITK
jgi:hypothetical protein